jgi:hypothetical protein
MRYFRVCSTQLLVSLRLIPSVNDHMSIYSHALPQELCRNLTRCAIFDNPCVPLLLFPSFLTFDVFLVFFLCNSFFVVAPQTFSPLPSNSISFYLMILILPYAIGTYLFDNIVYSITYISYHQPDDGHSRLPSSSIPPRSMAFVYVSGLLDKSCVADYLSQSSHIASLLLLCFCWLFLFCCPQYASYLCFYVFHLICTVCSVLVHRSPQ